MNVKKYLKEQARKDLQALETERDREFLQRLKNNVQSREEGKKAFTKGATECKK